MVIKRFYEGGWHEVLADGTVGARCAPPTDEERKAMESDERRRKNEVQATTPAAGVTSVPVAEPVIPGAFMCAVLRGIGAVVLVLGILQGMMTSSLVPPLVGTLGVVGSFASATMIDLLRIIAAKK